MTIRTFYPPELFHFLPKLVSKCKLSVKEVETVFLKKQAEDLGFTQLQSNDKKMYYFKISYCVRIHGFKKLILLCVQCACVRKYKRSSALPIFPNKPCFNNCHITSDCCYIHTHISTIVPLLVLLYY